MKFGVVRVWPMYLFPEFGELWPTFLGPKFFHSGYFAHFLAALGTLVCTRS